MKNILVLSLLTLLYSFSFGQNYTSYFTGNATDVVSTPQGGICMMGGATENDEAMKWFLQRCNGGDVLVLRATGSNGYNDYMYSSLGVSVNSVETIVCNNSAASYDPYVLQKIQQAEGIWFAGGDQWTYVSYWRNTPVAALVNDAITQRHIVVGGTSAGMAILGRVYFSAQNGTVTSATALADPYSVKVTVDSNEFIRNTILDSVITDTHYDNPDRRGRQVTFLARAKKDWNYNIKGIACDEYTAVCIDNTGIASVYGNYPTSDDNAYFIQNNCEILNNKPETVISGVPLTWNQTNAALKVYNVKGTQTGSNTFNLNDWKSGSGGTWQRWYVINGSLQTAATTVINCSALPVTLLNFSAAKENDRVNLNWQTSSESNSSYFEVEKSVDGVHFEIIKTISASGNSNQVRSYYCSDMQPYQGINYYRLEEEDQDGNIKYLAIKSVSLGNIFSRLNVYPNPVIGNSFTIKSALNQGATNTYFISDMSGRIIKTGIINSGEQQVNLSQIAPGNYSIKLSNGDNVMWQKK